MKDSFGPITFDVTPPEPTLIQKSDRDRRDTIAVAILNGILSKEGNSIAYDQIKHAVQLADTLIAELDKEVK